MSIKVKGFLKDVGGASRVTKLREENFAKVPRSPIRRTRSVRWRICCIPNTWCSE